ncbi:hypothetical protein HHI36_002970 [Cryptolaemus montrouzieri]|uniref:MIT domain-containing protein n=1 Tax=Cryptolaemus montrouzieri TaxID=559131 RepID=A0ABD2PC05_9CUCU
MKKASVLLTKATEEDGKRNYIKAVPLYEEGLEHLLYVMNYEVKEEQIKECIKRKADMYSKRVEKIKNYFETVNSTEHGEPTRSEETDEKNKTVRHAVGLKEGHIKPIEDVNFPKQTLDFMTLSLLLKEGIHSVVKAVEEDRNGNYVTAVTLYEQGLEYFLYVMNYELHQKKTKEIMRRKAASYLVRVEIIKNYLEKMKYTEHGEASNSKVTNEKENSEMPSKDNVIGPETIHAKSIEDEREEPLQEKETNKIKKTEELFEVSFCNSPMEIILQELECPICGDYLKIPIKLCATGHSVCGKCCEKLDRCALCHKEYTDSRNFAFESLVLKLEYPCFYKKAGCNQLLSYADREAHEKTCRFGCVQEN